MSSLLAGKNHVRDTSTESKLLTGQIGSATNRYTLASLRVNSHKIGCGRNYVNVLSGAFWDQGVDMFSSFI